MIAPSPDRSAKLVEVKFEITRRLRRNGKEIAQLLLVVLIAAGVTALWALPPGPRLELAVLRPFYAVRGARPPPKDVVIVGIDDVSYQALNEHTSFPLPRHYIAEALEEIERQSPRLMILDAKIPYDREADPAADARIEAALRAGPTTIELGSLPQEPSLHLYSADRFRRAAKLELPMTLFGIGDVITYISSPDDGATRSLFEAVPISKALVELGGIEDLRAPGPEDFTDFYGPPGTIPEIPIFKFALHKSPADAIRGKIVLIGYESYAYNKDHFRVPVSEKHMFGVEIHATTVGNLLERSWLRRLPMKWEMIVLFVLSFLLSTVVMRLHPLRGVLVVVSFLTLATLLAYHSFASYHFWFSGLIPLGIAGVLSLFVSAVYGVVRSDAFKAFFDTAFAAKKTYRDK